MEKSPAEYQVLCITAWWKPSTLAVTNWPSAFFIGHAGEVVVEDVVVVDVADRVFRRQHRLGDLAAALDRDRARRPVEVVRDAVPGLPRGAGARRGSPRSGTWCPSRRRARRRGSARAGSFRPGFSALISGASHCVIWPAKMRPSTSPVRCSWYGPILAMLTTGTTPVITVGNITRSFFFRSAALAMTSEAPKSTSCLLILVMPAPEPTGRVVERGALGLGVFGGPDLVDRRGGGRTRAGDRISGGERRRGEECGRAERDRQDGTNFRHGMTNDLYLGAIWYFPLVRRHYQVTKCSIALFRAGSHSNWRTAAGDTASAM